MCLYHALCQDPVVIRLVSVQLAYKFVTMWLDFNYMSTLSWISSNHVHCPIRAKTRVRLRCSCQGLRQKLVRG